MAEDDTVEHLFKIQIETETVGGDFYADMAEKFDHLPDISQFFGKLAKDEESHIQNLKDVRDSLLQKELQMPADPNTLFNAKEASKLRELIKTRGASFKTLEDSIVMTHDIEYSEVNKVYLYLVEEFSDSGDFKKKVVLELQDHLQSLMDFSEEYDSQKRKNILLKGGR